MSEDTGQILRASWRSVRSDYKGHYWVREENQEEKAKSIWKWFYERLKLPVRKLITRLEIRPHHARPVSPFCTLGRHYSISCVFNISAASPRNSDKHTIESVRKPLWFLNIFWFKYLHVFEFWDKEKKMQRQYFTNYWHVHNI